MHVGYIGGICYPIQTMTFWINNTWTNENRQTNQRFGKIVHTHKCTCVNIVIADACKTNTQLASPHLLWCSLLWGLGVQTSLGIVICETKIIVQTILFAEVVKETEWYPCIRTCCTLPSLATRYRCFLGGEDHVD